jgi:hypothetical protein
VREGGRAGGREAGRVRSSSHTCASSLLVLALEACAEKRGEGEESRGRAREGGGRETGRQTGSHFKRA